MTWAPAAHGLPLNCWRLAASTNPVRGTSTLAISRAMCGRSLGSRPRAFVRSLGSRPKVDGCGGETVLDCTPAADVPLEGSNPYAFDHVYERERLPAVRPSLLDRHDQPVVGERVVVGIGQGKRRAAAGVTAVFRRNTGTLRPSARVWCPRRTARRHPSSR